MAGRGRPRGARTREIAPVYGEIEGILSRLRAAVETLGNNKVARILRVSPSQPSRWRSGAERPAPDQQRRIVELDHVLARLFEDMVPVVALDWLDGHNQVLGGGRPFDALVLGHFDDVVAAIEVEELGGFA